ncbi:MAG: hypothetical protein JWO08_2236 [Verrucomicrobiaceae bacterium]|nr:hypothetical protein [Verrucomicrobiaceae bacterium]
METGGAGRVPWFFEGTATSCSRSPFAKVRTFANERTVLSDASGLFAFAVRQRPGFGGRTDGPMKPQAITGCEVCHAEAQLCQLGRQQAAHHREYISIYYIVFRGVKLRRVFESWHAYQVKVPARILLWHAMPEAWGVCSFVRESADFGERRTRTTWAPGAVMPRRSVGCLFVRSPKPWGFANGERERSGLWCEMAVHPSWPVLKKNGAGGKK